MPLPATQDHVFEPPATPPAGTVVVDTRRHATRTLGDWVDRFAVRWNAPSGRLEEIMDILSPDVRLVAPPSA